MLDMNQKKNVNKLAKNSHQNTEPLTEGEDGFCCSSSVPSLLAFFALRASSACIVLLRVRSYRFSAAASCMK